ncbi:MAG: hypothetical protein PHT40_00905 [Patescibacteria group bacterium]|nr:hypothetical protein [Patescibacteria group bacterium]
MKSFSCVYENQTKESQEQCLRELEQENFPGAQVTATLALSQAILTLAASLEGNFTKLTAVTELEIKNGFKNLIEAVRIK